MAHALGSSWRGRSLRRVGSQRPIKFLGRAAAGECRANRRDQNEWTTKGFAETGPVRAARPCASLYTASNLVVRCGQIKGDLDRGCYSERSGHEAI
ncbi:hypothetical protein HPB50_002249 [Hyalomma asiaticum]|uniref:Uncharacterized protein n=1 Tax=Hyalomma asiaticum TaxID=266040 RepID=A0ACB7TFM8_HYAAI|nr:hypothetical protein HPB50_002249 [Hyalomma asiaticum]